MKLAREKMPFSSLSKAIRAKCDSDGDSSDRRWGSVMSASFTATGLAGAPAVTFAV